MGTSGQWSGVSTSSGVLRHLPLEGKALMDNGKMQRGVEI